MATPATVSATDSLSDSDPSVTHPRAQDSADIALTSSSNLNPSMKLAQIAMFYDLISSAGSVAQLLRTLEDIKNSI